MSLLTKNQVFGHLVTRSIALALAVVLGLFGPSIQAAKTVEDAIKAIAEGNDEIAIKILVPLAESGDSVAQYNLGWIYQNGAAEFRDEVKSRIWFTKGAEGGDQDAQYRLIGILIDDKATNSAIYSEDERVCFVQHINEVGKVVLKLCKESGVPETYQQLDKWLVAITQFPSENLLAYLNQESQRGKPEAQLILGMLYDRGSIFEKNELLALEYYEAAANSGIPVAQTLLAALLISGNQIEPDYFSSQTLLVEAASKGYREAQYRLGRLLTADESPIENIEEALFWFLESDWQGDLRSAIHLGFIYYDRKEYSVALEWFRKAEKAGDDLASYKIAEMQYFGHGFPKRLESALRRLRQLAKSDAALETIEQLAEEKGEVFAQVAIAYLYSGGHKTRRDLRKAFEYYTRAAIDGDMYAQKQMGDFYFGGIHVTQNLNIAKQWYEKAAAQGDKHSRSMVTKVEARIIQKEEDEREAERLRLIAEAEAKRIAAENAQKAQEAAEAAKLQAKAAAKVAQKKEEDKKEADRQRLIAEAETKRISDEKAKEEQRKRELQECEDQWRFDEKDELLGSGSGFVVNAKGYAITNYHVVEDCNAVSVWSGDDNLATLLVTADPTNDLAILRICHQFSSHAKFRNRRDPIKQGEEIISYGFPIPRTLSWEPKINKGMVNALEVGNDYRRIQHSAPTHPGNSGGPLFDITGAVIGVAVKTFKKEAADEMKIIAQNINVGIKANQVTDFLQAKRIDFTESDDGGAASTIEIADLANEFTVMILCYGEK